MTTQRAESEFGYSHVDGTPVADPHWDAKVVDMQVLTGTIVYLKFADGFEGSLDLRPIMRGPIFERVFELGGVRHALDRTCQRRGTLFN